MQKIHGPTRDPNGEYKRRKNTDLEKLYNKPNIRKYMKAKRLEWAGHVWRADGSLSHNVLVENLNKKRPRDRPRQRCMDRMIMNRITMGMTRWRDLVEVCKKP